MERLFMTSDLAKLTLLILISVFTNNLKGQDNWPQWRGPNGNGVALKGDPPIEFNETKNLKWKAEIPGKGHSTPIIWGDKVFVSTAVPTDRKPGEGEQDQEGGRLGPPSNSTEYIHKFMVICYDRQNGDILWERVMKEEIPLERTHELGSWASNSAVTDGEYLYAYFGSRGIFCLDFDGKLGWMKDFGQMDKVMSFGEGSSPALYGNALVILWDHQGESFIVALDTRSGDEVWRIPRDEITSWSTPLILEVNGEPQVITAATNKVRSYDLADGSIIWECEGLTRNVIPNPVYADGILYLMSGYRGNALMAIDLDRAKGDITGTDVILWEYNQDTPYTPSPVLMNGYLYFLRANNAALTCLDARTGEVQYSKERVGDMSTLYSSPTGVNDRLYIAAEGVVNVVKAGPTYSLLASNPIDDNFHASPVIVGDQLILRGFKYLYCFEQ